MYIVWSIAGIPRFSTIFSLRSSLPLRIECCLRIGVPLSPPQTLPSLLPSSLPPSLPKYFFTEKLLYIRESRISYTCWEYWASSSISCLGNLSRSSDIGWRADEKDTDRSIVRDKGVVLYIYIYEEQVEDIRVREEGEKCKTRRNE